MNRQQPAHPIPISAHNRSILVFLTVCTKDRRRLLADGVMHQRILESWQQSRHWLIGKYVILPDHVHLFCAPGTYPPLPLKNWVKYWKRLVTLALPEALAQPLWQLDFWDTQLRRNENYAAKWEYVRNNPVRHGYVANADDWPYQGELNRLEWHD